jgi:hypothetical protein
MLSCDMLALNWCGRCEPLFLASEYGIFLWWLALLASRMDFIKLEGASESSEYLDLIPLQVVPYISSLSRVLLELCCSYQPYYNNAENSTLRSPTPEPTNLSLITLESKAPHQHYPMEDQADIASSSVFGH